MHEKLTDNFKFGENEWSEWQLTRRNDNSIIEDEVNNNTNRWTKTKCKNGAVEEILFLKIRIQK
jgi:hypothetical protein